MSAWRSCSVSAPSHWAPTWLIKPATRSLSRRPRKRNTPAECNCLHGNAVCLDNLVAAAVLLYERYELRPVIEPGLSAELFPDGQRSALAHLAKAVAPTRPLRRPSQIALDLRIRNAAYLIHHRDRMFADQQPRHPCGDVARWLRVGRMRKE